MSTEENPTHTYNGYGSYTVTLQVSGPGGVDVETKFEYIQLTDQIFADGYESGGLEMWTGSQTGGGDLRVTAGAARREALPGAVLL